MNDTSLHTPEPDPLEDVWIFAYYPVNTGPDPATDRKAADIGHSWRAKAVGAGVTMIEPRERDIQWRIPRLKAEGMGDELRAAGFRVDVRNIPRENA